MKKLLIADYGDIALDLDRPSSSAADTRTTHLFAALAKGRILPARVVCVSTSSVYGDCGGARPGDAA